MGTSWEAVKRECLNRLGWKRSVPSYVDLRQLYAAAALCVISSSSSSNCLLYLPIVFFYYTCLGLNKRIVPNSKLPKIISL